MFFCARAGFLVNDVKFMYLNGVDEFFNSWNNLVNTVIFILLATSYGLKFYTMIVVAMGKAQIGDHSFWHEVSLLETHNDTVKQASVYQTFYWLNSGTTK